MCAGSLWLPTPLPRPVSVSVPLLIVVSPTGFGVPRSVHVHGDGQACAGATGAIVFVIAPTERPLKPAEPVAADPESATMPCNVAVGRSIETVDPGMSV